MRILLVLEACGGGTGRHVLDLARGLLARGHEVALRYSPRRADQWFLDELAVLEGLDAREISLGRAISLNDISVAWTLRRALDSAAPYDILHGHSSKAGAVLRLAQIGRRTPVIYTPHAPITMDPDLSKVRKGAYLVAERLLAGLSHSIICVSPAERDHLRNLGFAADKVHVVYNGIGMQPAINRTAVRRRLNLTETTVCFGCVGRLSHQKAIDRALRSFALTTENIPDSRLVVVGDGPELEALKNLAIELEVSEQVHFAGAVSGSEMMAAFDVFLLPSRYEGMPYVLLEAAARQLPMIMSDVGGAHLVVRDGENGYVVADPKIENLAERMTMLAGDQALRRTMAARSAKIAAEFSLEQMVEGTLRVYSAAVSAAQ